MKIKHIIYIVPVLFAACSTFSVDKPASFAEYRMHDQTYNAISSDYVRVKVRRIDNDSAGTSALWSETADLHLRSMGYKQLKRESFRADSGIEGQSTEYLYRFNGENWVYRVVIFADEKYIHLAEAGGIEQYYRKHEKEIEASFKSFRPEK